MPLRRLSSEQLHEAVSGWACSATRCGNVFIHMYVCVHVCMRLSIDIDYYMYIYIMYTHIYISDRVSLDVWPYGIKKYVCIDVHMCVCVDANK